MNAQQDRVTNSKSERALILPFVSAQQDRVTNSKSERALILPVVNAERDRITSGKSENTVKCVQKSSFLEKTVRRLRDRSGLARIHIILACLCAALFAVAIVIPWFKEYDRHGQMVACAESLRVVNGALIIQLLENGEAETLKDAEADLVSILPGRDGYCPMGGNVYFRKDENGAWGAVCGLHDSDKKERTRLNASYVLSKIGERVRAAQRSGGKYPEQVTVQLNSKRLVCKLVSEETNFRRGTSTTKGYENEGTVAFYGLSGYGSFGKSGGSKGSKSGGSSKNSGSPESGETSGSGAAGNGDNSEGVGDSGNSGASESSGSSENTAASAADKSGAEVCYFSFADENYNATWREVGGWTGSSYGDRY